MAFLPAPVEDFGNRIYEINRQTDRERIGAGAMEAISSEGRAELGDREVMDGGGEERGDAGVGGSTEAGSTEGATTQPGAPKPGLGGGGPADPLEGRREPLRVSGAVDDALAAPDFSPNLAALALLGFILGASLGNVVARGLEHFLVGWEKAPPGDRLLTMVGTLVGLVAGVFVSLPFMITFQGRIEGTLISVGLVVGCIAATISLLRPLAPYLPMETSAIKSRRTGLKVLDTNVLIDGRVYDLLRTGFLDGDIYVPQFVLLELQKIADSSDGLRRERGRRGLEVLKRIQSEFTVEVGTRDRYAGAEREEVDTRLVRLAKSLGGDLVSNDFNLNRVAQIQDVRVLNVNELALALRPNVLPGEMMEVHLVREGNQFGQGVGYLDDGTMVVVERGRELIGETASVTVTQVIQTERGKMIFAEAPVDGADPEEPSPLPPQPKRRGYRGGQR